LAFCFHQNHVTLMFLRIEISGSTCRGQKLKIITHDGSSKSKNQTFFSLFFAHDHKKKCFSLIYFWSCKIFWTPPLDPTRNKNFQKDINFNIELRKNWKQTFFLRFFTTTIVTIRKISGRTVGGGKKSKSEKCFSNHQKNYLDEK